MTSFHIDSIVREDGSIVISSQALTPGTMVHITVTTDEILSSEKYSLDDLITSIDGLLADCDPNTIEDSRMEYLLEKYK